MVLFNLILIVKKSYVPIFLYNFGFFGCLVEWVYGSWMSWWMIVSVDGYLVEWLSWWVGVMVSTCIGWWVSWWVSVSVGGCLRV